jgi:hypothetical protein
MRPSRTVARAALTAVLAIGALPGLVGSREPSRDRPLDAAQFRQVFLATTRDSQSLGALDLDAAGRSDGALGLLDAFGEPAGDQAAMPGERAQPRLRDASADWQWNAPRSTVSGSASFYDVGTTAMRLPRGTIVVICGAGGCIERVVTDYGPATGTGRIIDMYRPDFFRICGCGWWSGTTTVTVRIY